MASNRVAGIDRERLQRWTLNVLAPAAVATAVYWFIAGPTLLELGIFLAVFLVTLVAIEYFLDLRLEV